VELVTLDILESQALRERRDHKEPQERLAGLVLMDSPDSRDLRENVDQQERR